MSRPLPQVSACPECAGPVVVSFEYWQPGLIAHNATWVCPHCDARVELGFVGRITSVAKGSPPRAADSA